MFWSLITDWSLITLQEYLICSYISTNLIMFVLLDFIVFIFKFTLLSDYD